MAEKMNIFEEKSISKAVWTLAVPSILATLVTIVYNVADTFFIGRTGDPDQVAAVSLAMPVFMVMTGIGVLFGTGGSTTVSRNLGEGKAERVRRVSSFSFYGSLFLSLMLGILILSFLRPLTGMLGASEDTSGYVVDYLSYLGWGAPFIVVSNVFGFLVRSDGKAKAALTGMLIGTVTNIILDPVFILLFGMGVRGAAIATVLGNLAAAGFYLLYMSSGKTVMSIRFRDLRCRKGIGRDVVSMGIPGSIGNLLMSLAFMFLNVYLAGYGDGAVAAMGVATKGNMIPAMLFGGFTMSVQPLLAYAYGAGDYPRLKSLVRYSLTASILIGAGIALIFIAAAPQFIRVFIDDPAILPVGIVMVRALMSTVVLLGVFFFSTVVNQVVNRPGDALLLTVSRQGLLFIPAIALGNSLFGLDGLIWAQPAADILSALLGMVMLVRNMRTLDNESQKARAKESLARAS